MTQDIDTGQVRRTALAATPAPPESAPLAPLERLEPAPLRRPIATAGLVAAAVVGLVLAVLALVVGVAHTVDATGASGAGTLQSQGAPAHQVTYRVTTTRGSRVTATYSGSRHGDLTTTTVRGAASPWSAGAEVAGFVGPNVVASLTPDADHVGRSDRITCTIVEDGVQVAEDSDWGPNASVSCTK
jgi:hypothetical protein